MKKQNDEARNLIFSNITKYQSYTYRWCNIDTGPHKHQDFYELCLITNGAFMQHYREDSYLIETGTLFLFDIGKSHRIVPHPIGSTHFTFCFTKPYFQILMSLFSFDLSLISSQGYIECKLNKETFQYLLMLANAISTGHRESNNVKLFFFTAMSVLLPITSDTLLKSNDMVDDIIEKMHNYSYLTVNVQDIYKQYAYSPPTIIKKFKQRTGMTIVRYQTNIRLECAAQLIRETNYPIEQIVSDLDFLSSSHFFEIFKERYGMTPSAYRKLAKEHPENYELLQVDEI